jgi:hypothetical protein
MDNIFVVLIDVGIPTSITSAPLHAHLFRYLYTT